MTTEEYKSKSEMKRIEIMKQALSESGDNTSPNAEDTKMTHEELLAKINEGSRVCELDSPAWSALRGVVELHKPEKRIINLPASGETEVIFCSNNCEGKYWLQTYPCPTIQAIEKELA